MTGQIPEVPREPQTEKAAWQKQTIEWTEEVAKKKGVKYQARRHSTFRIACSRVTIYYRKVIKNFRKSSPLPLESISLLTAKQNRFSDVFDAKREITRCIALIFSCYSITFITNSLVEISTRAKKGKIKKKRENERKTFTFRCSFSSGPRV